MTSFDIEYLRQKLTEARSTQYPDIVECTDDSRPDRRELALASWVRAYADELLDEVERLCKAWDQINDMRIDASNRAYRLEGMALQQFHPAHDELCRDIGCMAIIEGDESWLTR